MLSEQVSVAVRFGGEKERTVAALEGLLACMCQDMAAK